MKRKLAKKLEEKFEKSFTTNTEVNPVEHCNATIIRSGKVWEKGVKKRMRKVVKKSESKEKRKEEEI